MYNGYLPIGSLANEELLGLPDFDLPSFIDSAPAFQITSKLMDLPNLSDYDIDEHTPQNIDSRYFNLPELSSLQLSSTDLSILHTNIRSLFLHHDELVSLCAHTNLNSKVIEVSEIWHSTDNPLSSNVDIPGYTFFKTQSLTQNGGVGLYTNDSLTLYIYIYSSKIYNILTNNLHYKTIVQGA